METPARDSGIAALAIGEQVEASSQQVLEQFGAEPAAIKDHCQAPLAHEGADLFQYPGQHFHQAGVGFGRDDKQWIASLVVDPIVRGGGQGDAHAGHMGLGKSVLAVVDPHMAVDVKESQGRSAQRDPLLSQGGAELGGPARDSQTSQLAPECFNFRCPVQPKHSPQALGRIFFQTLRAFDAPQRHEEQSQKAGAQPIEGRAKAAVDFLGAGEDTAANQDGQRQKNSGACAVRR